MSQLPQKRLLLSRPAPSLTSTVARVAAKAVWRSLHPSDRERFVEAPAPRALTRLYYQADDGWQSPLYVLPPAPGGAGEPVILAHTLGVGADGFRYGDGPSLARALSDAGFAVYLLAHRGDAEAYAPRGARAFDFDDILEQDVPAALQRVLAHSGFPRAHWVGHGLGGQLGLAWAGRSRSAGLASVTALCAAVQFLVPASEVRRAALATRWLPAHWRIPARALAQLAAPLVDAQPNLGRHLEPGCSAGARVRGVLQYATEDLSIGLLRQVSTWLRAGALVDRTGLLDYGEALASADVPLLVLVAEADRVCPPEWATPAVEHWGGLDACVLRVPGLGHLDMLLGTAAPDEVYEPVCAWLDGRRRLAWEEEPGLPRFVQPA